VEVLEDISTVDGTVSESKLDTAKFVFASYLKLAEKGDPNRYEAKADNKVAVNRPTMIVINTGLPNTRIQDRIIKEQTNSVEIKNDIIDATFNDIGDNEKVMETQRKWENDIDDELDI
jgi:hypothetical protein